MDTASIRADHALKQGSYSAAVIPKTGKRNPLNGRAHAGPGVASGRASEGCVFSDIWAVVARSAMPEATHVAPAILGIAMEGTGKDDGNPQGLVSRTSRFIALGASVVAGATWDCRSGDA
jgi:hypothetical protein